MVTRTRLAFARPSRLERRSRLKPRARRSATNSVPSGPSDEAAWLVPACERDRANDAGMLDRPEIPRPGPDRQRRSFDSSRVTSNVPPTTGALCSARTVLPSNSGVQGATRPISGRDDGHRGRRARGELGAAIRERTAAPQREPARRDQRYPQSLNSKCSSWTPRCDDQWVGFEQIPLQRVDHRGDPLRNRQVVVARNRERLLVRE